MGITPPLASQNLFAHHLGDGRKRGGRLGEVSFRALRVSLVEELVHLQGVRLAQALGVDLFCTASSAAASCWVH